MVSNEDPRMEVLRSSNRMRMIHRQLVDTLMDFAVDAAAQREALSSAQTMLTPTCVEQVFGNVEERPVHGSRHIQGNN